MNASSTINPLELMSETSQPSKSPLKKIIVLAAVVAAAVVGYIKFGDVLSFEFLATKESVLQTFKTDHPLLVVGIAFAIYVAITGLSLPGAAILTLVYGWFFGFSQGLLLVSFASTAGATLAFLFSRFVLRDTIEAKFGERLKKVNSALEKEGAFYLFTLRLLPVMPFFIINLLMGLTPVKTRTYWWVSQLGMLPGTAVYVYAGSQVPSLQTLADRGAGGILSPGLLIAFVLLGIFPIAVKKIMSKIKKSA